MFFAVKALSRLVDGTAHERVAGGVALVSWFSVGAFTTSTLAYYVDPFLSVDLVSSSDVLAVVGGICAASVVATLKAV